MYVLVNMQSLLMSLCEDPPRTVSFRSNTSSLPVFIFFFGLFSSLTKSRVAVLFPRCSYLFTRQPDCSVWIWSDDITRVVCSAGNNERMIAGWFMSLGGWLPWYLGSLIVSQFFFFASWTPTPPCRSVCLSESFYSAHVYVHL